MQFKTVLWIAAAIIVLLLIANFTYEFYGDEITKNLPAWLKKDDPDGEFVTKTGTDGSIIVPATNDSTGRLNSGDLSIKTDPGELKSNEFEDSKLDEDFSNVNFEPDPILEKSKTGDSRGKDPLDTDLNNLEGLGAELPPLEGVEDGFGDIWVSDQSAYYVFVNLNKYTRGEAEDRVIAYRQSGHGNAMAIPVKGEEAYRISIFRDSDKLVARRYLYSINRDFPDAVVVDATGTKVYTLE